MNFLADGFYNAFWHSLARVVFADDRTEPGGVRKLINLLLER